MGSKLASMFLQGTKVWATAVLWLQLFSHRAPCMHWMLMWEISWICCPWVRGRGLLGAAAFLHNRPLWLLLWHVCPKAADRLGVQELLCML